MDSILKKLHLIKNIEISLPISKLEFSKRFRENVTESDLGFNLFSGFEVFSSNKNDYKGFISNTTFKLKRIRKLFDNNAHMAIANGKIIEDTNGIHLKIEVKAYTKFLLFFYSFLGIFYSVFLIGILFTEQKQTFFVIPFILIHAAFMILIPYFILKRSLKKLESGLEKEFYYWTKK